MIFLLFLSWFRWHPLAVALQFSKFGFGSCKSMISMIVLDNSRLMKDRGGQARGLRSGGYCGLFCSQVLMEAAHWSQLVPSSSWISSSSMSRAWSLSGCPLSLATSSNIGNLSVLLRLSRSFINTVETATGVVELVNNWAAPS